MNEETYQILKNQKLILRCFLYDEKVTLKDEINNEIIQINNILFPELTSTLQEKTHDALSDNVFSELDDGGKR